MILSSLLLPHILFLDFGLSRVKSEVKTHSNTMGAAPWTAPEVIRGAKFREESDVYSFGVVMWEILTAQHPCPDSISPLLFVNMVLEKGHRPPLPEDTPEPIAELIKECWETNPDVRPTFVKVVKVLEDLRQKAEFGAGYNVLQNNVQKKRVLDSRNLHQYLEGEEFTQPSFEHTTLTEPLLQLLGRGKKETEEEKKEKEIESAPETTEPAPGPKISSLVKQEEKTEESLNIHTTTTSITYKEGSTREVTLEESPPKKPAAEDKPT